MKQINWGIIGCGKVTEMKSGPAFNKVPGSGIVAVMRRNEAKAEDYAKRHNVPVWYTNADELIADPNVNAVYIATPPSSHCDYAIRVLKSGKPVYVEKPMAASYEECVRMKEMSETTGLPLFVAYYRRYLPYFIKVKEIISGRHLGKILYAKIDFHIPPRVEDYNPDALPWRVMPEIAGAGYFYDLACHQLDLMEWYFGKPVKVQGSVFNRRGLYKAEDLVSACVEYESEVPVIAQWCFVAANDEHTDTITFFGERGSLEFSTFDFTPIRLAVKDKVESYLPPNPVNIQYWLIKNMVEELQRSKPVKGNVDSAVRTNWVMDKILGKI